LAGGERLEGSLEAWGKGGAAVEEVKLQRGGWWERTGGMGDVKQ
jgi:hypothetical protein